MAAVSIHGSDLTIDIQGMDKLWTFKSRLTIPISHVRGASADPTVLSQSKGWRGPGTHVPGLVVAGTFHPEGQKVFWDVHDENKAIVIELEDDTYQRLVIEVDDPGAAVALIQGAVDAHS
jgi:hypothetical protein